jgi:hypothetical protein
MIRRKSAVSTSGFTLIETAIASVILVVVGYSVSLTVEMGNDSNATVLEAAQESRTQRRTVAALIDDVRTSTNARITVTTAGDGNSIVQLQQPVTVAGAFAWGVRDRRLGDDEAGCTRLEWTVRYRVDGNARLLRRTVDAAGYTQLEDVLAEDVVTTDGNPGFRMVQTGAVWEVRTRTLGGESGASVSESEFHIRTRN